MVNKLIVAILLTCIATATWAAWPSSGKYAGNNYIGPCDVVSCAEAYSLTRSMHSTYFGPLFQLYNGTTTLDIGQTNNRTVNLSTWSSFCSSVPSNCVISKIYGQINSNNLVPSTVMTPFSVDCSTGGTYVCAAAFTLDANNGLPILVTVTPSQYYVGASVGSSDTATTGITAGGAALSIVFDGRNMQHTYCCGLFGMAHVYNQPIHSNPGYDNTDFMVSLPYNFPTSPCTTTNFCGTVDWEGTPSGTDMDVGIVSTVPAYLIYSITWNPSGSGTVTAYNGTSQLFQNSPPTGISPCCTVAAGKFIHVGGGGDLSEYATALMREALITNSTLSSGQVTSINSNMNTFYNAQNKYIGLGDLIPGAAIYVGLRGYSNASIGTKAINVRRSSDSHTCDALIASTGDLGNTANCSNGADNAQAISAFCNATTCFATKVYDQTGNGNDVSQATNSQQPQLTFNCVNNRPCLTYNNANSTTLNASACAITSTPVTTGQFSERTGNTSNFSHAFWACTNPGGSNNDILYQNSANTMRCDFNNDPTAPTQTVSDNAWHSNTCTNPVAGNGDWVLDGGDTNFVTANGWATGFNAVLGAQSFAGQLTEGYAWHSVVSVAGMKAICVNQNLFYGAAAC